MMPAAHRNMCGSTTAAGSKSALVYTPATHSDHESVYAVCITDPWWPHTPQAPFTGTASIRLPALISGFCYFCCLQIN